MHNEILIIGHIKAIKMSIVWNLCDTPEGQQNLKLIWNEIWDLYCNLKYDKKSCLILKLNNHDE